MTLMLLKYNHVMYLANRHLICTGSIPIGESLHVPSVSIAHASLSFASSTIPCGLSSITIIVLSHLVPNVVDSPFSAYERRRLLCSDKNVTENLRILFEFDVTPVVRIGHGHCIGDGLAVKFEFNWVPKHHRLK
jgi:hypothetical protein